MLIGLHDADAAHFRKAKTFPNFALMKIATYHKTKGHAVEWWEPLKNQFYDKIYSAKIFDFTPTNPYLPATAICGGTGYDTKSKLPPQIEGAYPDYSIYPTCHYAIGFITRGCPNHCRWCVVPEKEGRIRAVAHWKDLVRPNSDKLVLMDNNILASNDGIEQLTDMIGSKYKIDLNQGMDARLVTPEIAEILARLKWIKNIRFSCDQISQIEPIKRTVKLLQKNGVRPYKIFIYLLVTKDLQNAAYRVDQLKELGAITIYAQAERNAQKDIIPNAKQLEFCQRYIYGGTYRTETWLEYCKRRGLLYTF